jgi:phosphoribosylformylglycinamidine synthase PurS subunit
MKAKVVIMPKKDVLDPQGKAVSGALHSLGHSSVEEVRIGKLIVLDLDAGLSREAATEEVTRMCEALLANTVIEEYTIELED